MSRREIPLLWQKGFIGVDAPPHEVAGGCRLFDNVRLSAGKRSLRAIPGVRRNLHTRLEDTDEWALDNHKKLVLFDAYAVLGFRGVGIAVVDYALALPYRRVVAGGFNRDLRPEQFTDPRTGAAWDPDGEPVLVLDPSDFATLPTLRRMTAHEYPDVMTLEKVSYVLDRWSRGVMIRDGRPMPAGLMAPARRPALLVDGDVDLIDDCDGAAWDSGTAVASLVTPSGAGSMVDANDPYVFAEADYPIGDSGADQATAAEVEDRLEYQRLAISSSPAVGVLARNDGSFAFTADHTRLRVRVYWAPTAGGLLALQDSGPMTLPKGTLALSLSTNTGLGGTPVNYTIDRELQAGIWHWIDIAAAPGAITALSWGLRLMQTLPGAIFGNGRQMEIRVDRLEAVKGYAGPFTGKWRARVTHYDPATGMESAPSPESVEIDCGTAGAALRVEPEGYRGFWDTADNGFEDDPQGAPGDALVATKRHVYLWTPDYGRDGTSRERAWRRLTGPEGI